MVLIQIQLMNQEERNNQIFDTLIEKGYTFSLLQYLQRAFALLKEHWMFLGLFWGAHTLFGLILSAIPVVGAIVNNLIVSPILLAGFYVVLYKIEKQETVALGDFFSQFHKAIPLAQMAFIYFIMMLIVLSPSLYYMQSTGVVDFGKPFEGSELEAMEVPPQLMWIIGLNCIPFLYLLVGFAWATPLMVFYGLNAWNALEISRKLITKRWFSVFLLSQYIISISFIGLMIISSLSLILPFALALAPFMLIAILTLWYISNYIAFADVVKLGIEKKE